MSAVTTLVPYIGGSRTSNRLLAAWAGRWFDCARDWRGTGRTPHTQIRHPDGENALFGSDNWDTTTITNSGGDVFLVAANGSDEPVRFAGHSMTWARCTLAADYPREGAPAFRAENLRYCTTFHNRIWWAERDGRQLWYGDLYSPGGGLYPFPIGAPAGDDSDIAALATLTRDGGDGPREYLVVFFRSGTALVYEGDDPHDINRFRLHDRFIVGKPLGSRPLVPYGGDLIAVTHRGVIPVSTVVAGRGLQRSDFTTDIIRGAWDAAVRPGPSSTDWTAPISSASSRCTASACGRRIHAARTVTPGIRSGVSSWLRRAGIEGEAAIRHPHSIQRQPSSTSTATRRTRSSRSTHSSGP